MFVFVLMIACVSERAPAHVCVFELMIVYVSMCLCLCVCFRVGGGGGSEVLDSGELLGL